MKGNKLRIDILSLFVHIRSRFPNLVTGIITRDSVKEALRNGIGAEQVRGRIASGTLLTVPDHHVFNASCTSPDVQER